MAQPHQFELAGGHPALDFVNTIHDWTVTERRDYLVGFGDAIRFGEAAGVLTRAEARRLAATRAAAELGRLRRLRGLLERIFRAWVEAQPAGASDLAALAGALVEAARATRFRGARRATLRREITLDAAGAAALRLRIVDAAAGLLTSARLERVKACPTCGWFFLDTSKNHSRRWCSMDTCGASAKSKAYYRRTRGREVSSRSGARPAAPIASAPSARSPSSRSDPPVPGLAGT
jgi:predicted RNA-binding Zn ribbon-like protein